MHDYYSENDAWPRTLIYDVLKQQGYSTAMIASSGACRLNAAKMAAE